MKSLLLSLSFIFCLSHLYAQFDSPCGTDNEDFFNQVGAAVKSNDLTEGLDFFNDTTYTIPVIFHVVHTRGPENVTTENILGALDILNKDFNRQNADTLDIPLPFQQVRGNPKIQFKLARLDPTGNCTDGIMRYYSDKTCYISSDNFWETWVDLDDNIPAWDKRRYLNIYIVKCIIDNPTALNVSGYSVIPSINNPNWNHFLDHIVMRYDQLSSPINNFSPYSNGHIISHEVGHWLGLYHTFQSGSCDNTSTGDYVDDTPKQKVANRKCPTFPQVSCPSEINGDNFNNFMDYSDCRSMFTEGQVSRMLTCLQNTRSEIWQDSNLVKTGLLNGQMPCPLPPVANFGAGNHFGMYCEGSAINFFDASRWVPTSWKWTFEGGVPDESNLQNPSVVFPDTGSFMVRLMVSNPFGNDTIEQPIHVSLKKSIIVGPSESFEDNVSNGNIAYYNYQHPINTHLWKVADGVSYSGSKSMHLEKMGRLFSGFSTNTFDLDILPAGSHQLKFKIAHARDTSINYSDVNQASALLIILKNACSWNAVDLNDNGLSLYKDFRDDSLVTAYVTGPQPFIPTQDQWREMSVNIPEEYTGQVQISFLWNTMNTSHPQWFKGLYIDDVSIESAPTTTIEVAKAIEWKVYPNPFSDEIISEVKEDNSDLTLQVFTITGQHIIGQNQSASATTLDLSRLQKGAYLIQLGNSEMRFSKMIVKLED